MLGRCGDAGDFWLVRNVGGYIGQPAPNVNRFRRLGDNARFGKPRAGGV